MSDNGEAKKPETRELLKVLIEPNGGMGIHFASEANPAWISHAIRLLELTHNQNIMSRQVAAKASSVQPATQVPQGIINRFRGKSK